MLRCDDEEDYQVRYQKFRYFLACDGCWPTVNQGSDSQPIFGVVSMGAGDIDRRGIYNLISTDKPQVQPEKEETSKRMRNGSMPS